MLTLLVEYSNLFFSALFAVEMVLKVTAEGIFGYIREGFNVFDGFIVILRLDYYYDRIASFVMIPKSNYFVHLILNNYYLLFRTRRGQHYSTFGLSL